MSPQSQTLLKSWAALISKRDIYDFNYNNNKNANLRLGLPSDVRSQLLTMLILQQT